MLRINLEVCDVMFRSCARNEALASVVNLASMYNVSAMLDPKVR